MHHLSEMEEEVPEELRLNVMADAVAAASSFHRSPSRPAWGDGLLTLKRLVVAAVLLGALVIATSFLHIGTGPDIALADVVKAMAGVRSAHLISWSVNESGIRSDVEYYFDEPGKFVALVDGRRIRADDGRRYVKLYSIAGQPFAEIKPHGSSPAFDGDSLLQVFAGGKALDYFLQQGNAEIGNWKRERSPDGRSLSVAEIRGVQGARMELAIDTASRLVYRWTRYDASGRPVDGIERVEYNPSIDDSLFTVDIPEGTVLDDYMSPPPTGGADRRRAMAARLQARGAEVWCDSASTRPSGGTGMLLEDGELGFMCLGYGLWVGYLPSENRVYVLGKARVRSYAKGLKEPDGRLDVVVEDGSFTPPSRPVPVASLHAHGQSRHASDEQARAAMAKKLEASGAVTICSGIDKGGSCGTRYHEGLRFEALEDGMAVYYLPGRNAYYVVGRAEARYRNLRNGFSMTIENAEMKGPGSPSGP